MTQQTKGPSRMLNLRQVKKFTAAAAAVLVAAAAAVTIGGDGYATGGDGEPQPRGVDDEEGWLNYVDYYVVEDDEVDEVRTRLLDEIEEAEDRVDAAISQLDDAEIQQALVDAADRGVRVRVVADEEFEDADGFEPLVDHDDISVQFGDGELAYLPEPTLSPLLEHCRDEESHPDEYGHGDFIECTQSDDSDQRLQQNTNNEMVRPAHFNVMSHTFFLIDQSYVWNITAPLTDDQSVWFAFRAMSEELTNSFEREFRQMHGGVFATTLSVYNGPLKSITHQHPLRLTNRGQLRVRFNPQERLLKNVIDELYRARSSVWVMTENLTNLDVVDALLYKQENGFDVRVMVGQGQSEAEQYQEELAELDVVVAPEEMGRLPTVVVHDAARDNDDRRHPRIVQILSHELWPAEPFQRFLNTDEADLVGDSDWVRYYPSDTFADGVMWEVDEAGVGEENMYNPEVDPFVEQWDQMWEQAQ